MATSAENSLGVIDLSRFRVLDPVPLRGKPTAIITDRPSRRSYVLTPDTGSVHVLDRSLTVVRSRKLADEVSEIRVTPDGSRLAAISGKTQEWIEADANSLQVIRRHKLPGKPTSLDLAPGPYAAVSIGERGLIQLFELSTGRQWQTELPGRIGAVRFRADSERLLVGNLQEPGLTALTVPDLELVAELPLAMQPENLCFNADAGQLFVSGNGMDAVAIVFPYSPLEVDQTVLAGRDPGVMACSETPALLFVGSNSGSDVCVLNIDTRKVVGAVDVGERPTHIAITPGNQYALILARDAGTVAIVRIPKIRLDPSIVLKVEKPSAALFTILPVGNQPVQSAVVPFA